MSDEPEPVVPIRPGAEIAHERTRQLLEHVAAEMVDFTLKNGEEPQDIAFVIIGTEGSFRPSWLIEERWRSTLALSGAALTDKAMNYD